MDNQESVFVDVALLRREQRRYRRVRFLLGVALIIIYFQWLAIWELKQVNKPKDEFTINRSEGDSYGKATFV